MKVKKLHIILVLILLQLPSSQIIAQCDFFGTVTVVAAGYTTDAGYSQAYILVEDISNNPGDIMDLNTNGDFGTVDEGTYFIYAVNYSGAQPSELAVGESWTDLNTYALVSENCFEISGSYLDRAVSVCSADDICFGNPIEIAVENYEVSSGYLLQYILVSQTDGSIIDFNNDGSFSSTNYTSAGTFDAYALSTNDNDLISDLTQGMTFTDFTDLLNATCAGLLGPREVTVLDNDFVYVADGLSVEATEFCEVDGWTHYSTAANPHNFIFSIYKNTNDVSATVYIDVAAPGTNSLTSAADSEYSTHTLRRSWSVDASGTDYNSTSGSLTNPVKLRFYYPATEKALLNAITDDFLNGTNIAGVNATSFDHNYLRESRWFKSDDGDVLNLSTMTTAEQITDAYSLTVVGDDLTTSNGINYVELADITGFSGGTFAVGTGPNNFGDVLPVEYLSFSGFNDDEGDILNWVTASEINNDYFVVEVSSDMFSYHEVGRVEGSGNTNNQMKYTFVNSSFSAGTRYYRLKQVDFDGTYDYSESISIFSSIDELDISVFPNPFTDYISFKFSGVDEKLMANIQIYNNIGQLVYESDHDISAEDSPKISLKTLHSGVYFLKIAIDKRFFTFKIIKK